MKLFDAERGSNIGRGLFVVITYTTSIFNKMIIAGTASIMSRSIIQQAGGVMVSWGLWFAAFLPTAIVTIFAAWWFTLKLFPPEAASLEGRADLVKAHFSTTTAWTPLSIKAAVLSGLALLLWMTDWLHGVSAPIVAFAAGLAGLLPFVDVLDEKDFKKVNLLPFFFVAAALGMGEVLKVTGGLKILTDSFIGGVEPLLTSKAVALPALYWGGFIYHFVTASEISMLVASLPILMNFARSHALNPAWIGMIWSFSSGGKLFAYHVCDWKTPTTDLLLDRGLMGEGCIPLRQIRAWVEATGFKGWNEAEIFSTRYWAGDQEEFLGKIVQAYRDHV